MSNKLLLNNEDIPYEPSESEDELSDGEKQILKEVRKGKHRKTEDKQQILAFDESADSDDEDADDIIGDSDIERGDENDGIPDSKAWGKQRKAFYDTDFVDQDYSAYNEQEEEQAQQEEEEAKAIQLRLAKQQDEADFFLDLPDSAGALDSDEEEDAKLKSKTSVEESTNLKSDFSNMSQRQIQQLFKKDSPEFAGLVEDFHTYLDESKNILSPVIEFADSMDINLPIFDFVRARDNMIMTYCTNVAFYLLLKSQRISIKNHPITKRLVTLKRLINEVQERYEDVIKPQLEDLLERINSGETIEIDLKPVEKLKEKKSKKKLRMMRDFQEDEDGESGEEYDEPPSSKRFKIGGGEEDDDEDDGSTDEDEENPDEEIDEEADVERRGITYQIAKNKGLMPRRKKELRNPRVKNRGKFRKALIRRKGAVRTVRKETQRYGGELSGIKATTKKGIKIKS